MLPNLQATRDAFQAAVAGFRKHKPASNPRPIAGTSKRLSSTSPSPNTACTASLHELHEVSTDPHERTAPLLWPARTDRKNSRWPRPHESSQKKLWQFDRRSRQVSGKPRTAPLSLSKTCHDDLRLRIIQHPVGLMNGQIACGSDLSPGPPYRADQRAKSRPGLSEIAGPLQMKRLN